MHKLSKIVSAFFKKELYICSRDTIAIVTTE